MPSSSATVRHLALVALVIGTGPTFAQGASDPGTIIVQPARVPVVGSPTTYASLPSPPAGPIESRLLSMPPTQAAAAVPSTVQPAPALAPSVAGPLALVAFAGRSASLTEATKADLQRVAATIADKRIRHVELRAFASGGDPDSRKIALARALVVRSYLIDLKVKSRIEVGSFAGEGQQVEILAPNT